MGLCSECYERVENCNLTFRNLSSNLIFESLDNPIGESSIQNFLSSSGGRMDSKHFPSRSTTDNLPSSLSTPGERAGLTSGPTPTVDSQAVATSSSGTNTLSSHLPSSCGSSNPTDILAHNTSASAVDSGVEAPRVPPPSSGSEISVNSDKSYEPSLSPSNSCSSLASSTAASSSSKGHNSDEYFYSDSQTLPTAVTITSSHSQTDPSHTVASADETTNADSTKDVMINSSIKNNVKTTDSDETSAVPKLSSNAKSLTSSNQTTDCTSLLKDDCASLEVPTLLTPKQGVKRKRDEIESSSDDVPLSAPSPQKNKKRCFVCSCKLELAQRTIGKCRCDRIFCPTHRLPELHDCMFNHKEDGRREAREKMIKPVRHMGTSFRRDHHS